MNIYTIISSIANGISNGAVSLFNIITLGILSSVKSILIGFGLMVNEPLQTWAYDVANGSDPLIIPVIFTIILGVSIIIILAFVNIFGIEKDIENGIGGLMEL